MKAIHFYVSKTNTDCKVTKNNIKSHKKCSFFVFFLSIKTNFVNYSLQNVNSALHVTAKECASH